MSGIEILGIAAGVVQIAELGGKLSVKLFTFTRKIKNADRNIDSISQDIAATGAVLQQLGNELRKDEKFRLCSPEAIATAKSLMDECQRIFKELDDAVDGKGKGFGSGTKMILGLKQRLKYPFLEPQIELLKANLEKLKSSLLVMLNVLIFAEQLKNQEALPILKDQRELLKSLVEEKIASQKQYDQVLKRLDQLSVGNDDSSILSLSKETTRTSNSSVTLANLPSSFPEAPAQPDKASLLPNLPGHLHHRAEEIFDHCRLINAVIEEVHHTRYKLDLGIRYRTQEMIMDSHYNEWAGHVDAQGSDASGHDTPSRYEFLESTPQLRRHWEKKQQQQGARQRQHMQAYAQQQLMRQQQMMQQQQAMRAERMTKQQQSQQSAVSQEQQDTRAEYGPRAPYTYKTVPTIPALPTPFGPAAPSNLAAPSAESGIQALPAYQRQLMLSEGQDKKRLGTGQPDHGELSAGAPVSSTEAGSQALAGMTERVTGMKAYSSARLRGRPMQGDSIAAQSGNHALEGYQMQMILLEQQNKKRLMMAQQEQQGHSVGALDAASAPLTATENQASYPSPSNVTLSAPSRKRSRARKKSLGPLKRSKPGTAVERSEDASKMAAELEAPTPEFAKSDDVPQQHDESLEAPLLDGEETMHLDFSTSEAGDALDNFDFDSFLVGSNRAKFEFDVSEQAEDDEAIAVRTADDGPQAEANEAPTDIVPATHSDDHRPSDTDEKNMSEGALSEGGFASCSDGDDDTYLKMARPRSHGKKPGARPGEKIVPSPPTKLKSRTDRLVPAAGDQPGLWPRGKLLSPSPSLETLRPSRPSHSFLIEEDTELSDEPWQPPEYASKLPHDDENESGASIRRNSAGMFMPNEETEEDAAMNWGFLGSAKNAAYTAKDMAHLIWSGGRKILDDEGASQKSAKEAIEATQVGGRRPREEQEGPAEGTKDKVSSQIDDPLRHYNLDELGRAATDFAKENDTNPTHFIKAARIAKDPPNWKSDEGLAKAEVQNMTSDEGSEQGEATPPVQVTPSIQVRTRTLPLEPIETSPRTLPILRNDQIAPGAAGPVSPQQKQEDEEQQFDDAAEAASETDDVVGRAEVPDVDGEELMEEAEEEEEDEEEYAEAAEYIPMLEQEGTAEESREAVSSEPREHIPDQDGDMIAYSDEELQAENEEREPETYHSKSSPPTQFKVFSRDGEPVNGRSPKTTDDSDLDLCQAHHEDISEHGWRKRRSPRERISEQTERAESVTPKLSRNLLDIATAGMLAPQILVFDKEPRRRHSGRPSSADQMQMQGSNITKESVTESLTSILDFLERYTLLEGHDLERARVIVADT